MDKDLQTQFLSFDPVLLPPGVPEPVILDENGQPWLRIRADHAKTISMRVDPEEYALQKKGAVWEAPFPSREGITYVQLIIDGEEILSPYLPITYGYSRPYNCVVLPEEDSDFYRLKDVPHGSVRREYFRSSVTGSWGSCLVYTPPGYDKETDRQYPVLYLQHGHGENEVGWVASGKADLILDNLIAEQKAPPFLVVMSCGMVQVTDKEGKPGADHLLFPKLLTQDVIPFIEGKYRVMADRRHRAMAGLSMGSIHTSITAFTHPELFSRIGLFSGFLHDILKGDPLLDPVERPPSENEHLRALDDRKSFAAAYDVFFRAIGDRDPFMECFAEDDALLAEKEIPCIRKIYPGSHDWNVWRRCLRDFAQIVFAP